MLTKRIVELSEKYFKEISDIRRQIHMHPEVGYEEYKTSQLICDTLDKLGIEYERNIAKTGVVGIIRGKNPGKTILLRADMDALPMQESDKYEYKSKRDGYMHACGHDGHVAGLLGAAMILNELKDELHGNIKLLFQPDEENIGGAKPMIDEGVLKNPDVDAAIACHLWGSALKGKIEIKHGELMASRDTFKFKIIGKGGHGALPHLAIDPITLGAQAINSMQTIISRKLNPVKPGIISFCTVHSGSSHNIIPGELEVSGTIRTFHDDVREWIPKEMESILKGITESQGATYEFELMESYPPLFNNIEMTDLVINSTAKIVGNENVMTNINLSTGSEDFAYYAKEVPSAFYFVGIAEDENSFVCHHHPDFGFEDDCLLVSAQTLAQITVDFLQ